MLLLAPELCRVQVTANGASSRSEAPGIFWQHHHTLDRTGPLISTIMKQFPDSKAEERFQMVLMSD